MTIAKTPNPCFGWIAKFGGPVVDWADAHRFHIAGEGLSGWHALDHGPEEATRIMKNLDEPTGSRRVEISPARDGVRLFWNSSLVVGEGRHVRGSGIVESFADALAQCETAVPESRQIAGLTWWKESEGHWVSWLGSFSLSAVLIRRDEAESYWHFQSTGNAPTLEEAALLATMRFGGSAGATEK